MSTAEMLKFSLLLTPKKLANNVTIVVPRTGVFLNLCILFCVEYPFGDYFKTNQTPLLHCLVRKTRKTGVRQVTGK